MAFAAAAALIAVPALTLAVLLNFDWNRARPWLDARVSEALGEIESPAHGSGEGETAAHFAA